MIDFSFPCWDFWLNLAVFISFQIPIYDRFSDTQEPSNMQFQSRWIKLIFWGKFMGGPSMFTRGNFFHGHIGVPVTKRPSNMLLQSLGVKLTFL